MGPAAPSPTPRGDGPAPPFSAARADGALQEYSENVTHAVGERPPSPAAAANAVRGVLERLCGWCHSRLEVTAPKTAVFCQQKCRAAAFRLRRRLGAVEAERGGLRFAYADPPYPGKAARYYRNEPTFGGEVDHRELIASLVGGGYAGWALSTSAEALREILPLCPPEADVCPWVKPIGARPRSRGRSNCWEPLIVVGGRRERREVRDFLVAQPARFGGTLMGRKPLAFCAFIFEMLGMLPGDDLVDLYPGTGIVGRAWAEACR